MSRMSRYAAAAVVAVVAIVGYEALTRTGGVSWAQVRQQVQAVKAVTYTLTVTITGEEATTARAEVIQAGDLGMRMDTYIDGQLINRSFTRTADGELVSLMPLLNQYNVTKLSEALCAEMRTQSGDPLAMVDAFLAGAYTELGQREIDGVTAEGIEGVESDVLLPLGNFTGAPVTRLSTVAKSAGEAVGRLWVDVATGWPVELTLNVTDETGGEQVTVVLSDFQWEAQVDAQSLALEIPAGYRRLATLDVSRTENGAQLAEGLAYFAKLSGGTYPSALDARTIVGELGAIYEAQAAQGITPDFDDDPIIKLKMAGAYVNELAPQGQDPKYYGSTVTAADADKVLVRWRLEDGRYCVIFGDLRIESVSAERLAELEAQ